MSDYIIVAVIFILAITFLIYTFAKNKKRGGCSGCSGCSYSKNKEKDEK